MHNISRRNGEKKKSGSFRKIHSTATKKTHNIYERTLAVDRRATAPSGRQLEAGSESASPTGLGAALIAKPTRTYYDVVSTEYIKIDACGLSLIHI